MLDPAIIALQLALEEVQKNILLSNMRIKQLVKRENLLKTKLAEKGYPHA